jgi:pimeloyl-CoA synthetase
VAISQETEVGVTQLVESLHARAIEPGTPVIYSSYDVSEIVNGERHTYQQLSPGIISGYVSIGKNHYVEVDRLDRRGKVAGSKIILIDGLMDSVELLQVTEDTKPL